MRRRLLAVLLLLETAIFCAIVLCSLQASQEIARSGSAKRLVHVVVLTTQIVAARIAEATLD
jgi:hypothetical protein